MLSLILLALPLVVPTSTYTANNLPTQYSLNNYISTESIPTTSDASVYHVNMVDRDNYDTDEYDFLDGGPLSINIPFSSGSFTFYINAEELSYLDGSTTEYAYQFQIYSSVAYHSNIYLTNFKVYYYNDLGNHTFSLPNVNFLTSTYDSDNSMYYFSDSYDDDDFYLEGDFTSRKSFSLSFDLTLIPSNLFDGSQYQSGYSDGWNAGNDNGFNDGYSNGYSEGYSEGYLSGQDVDSTASTIFTGIIDVGLLPINFFLQILNFEVFGINIGGFVSALMTIAIVVIILRVVMGGKNDA